jgi:hypothetical protein
MIKTILYFTAACFISACTMLQGTITQFHVIDSSPRSFAVIPMPDQQNSLEFKSYANLTSDQLIAKGWQQVDISVADVAVFLQYQISQGRQVVFSYPIYGQVPTGSSTTSGTINTYGNFSTINTTTVQNTTTGIVGTGTGSRTVYDRAVNLTIYSMVAYRESQKMDRI